MIFTSLSCDIAERSYDMRRKPMMLRPPLPNYGIHSNGASAPGVRRIVVEAAKGHLQGGECAGQNILKCSPEIVMVDGPFWDDSFEQDRSWDDSGTTILTP